MTVPRTRHAVQRNEPNKVEQNQKRSGPHRKRRGSLARTEAELDELERAATKRRATDPAAGS
jgi:hypothetical protein